MAIKVLKLAAVLAPAVLAVGCATRTQQQPYDYRAFEASNPRSILVLPPLNNSPDVKATNSMYSSVTYPLAEAGYYVLPVSLVNETFKQNGLTTAADIHNVSTDKLREIFGADAALYMTVTQFGSSYNVLSSVITVAAKAKLVDLKTQAVLWEGEVTVVDDGNQGGNGGGGIVGLLVKAAVTQILNSSLNRSHEVAARANAMLLSGGQARGILYGPRSPNSKARDNSPLVAEAETASQAASKAWAGSTMPVMAPAPQPAPIAVPAAPMPAAVAPAAIATMPVPAPPVAASAPAVAAVAPTVSQAIPATAAPVAAPAPAPAAQLNAEQQRYAEALARARARHQALDPTSGWYRQDLNDWVMARRDEFIREGKSPDVALQLAVAAMERG